MPRYRILILWDNDRGDPELDLFEFTDYARMLSWARYARKEHWKRDHSLYYLRWEPGVKGSFWVGSFTTKELEGEDDKEGTSSGT